MNEQNSWLHGASRELNSLVHLMYSKSSFEQMFSSYSRTHSAPTHIWSPGHTTQTISRVSSEEGWRDEVEEDSEGEYSVDEMETTTGWV